jgi:hypothetical protein
MTRRALAAVVRERCRADRRTILFAVTSSAIVGFLQPRDAAALAGSMFFCSTIGIAIALLVGPGRYPYLDLCERSAPLFGRELARAKALVPALVAVVTTLVYWCAHSMSGLSAPPALFVLLSLACTLASTLVALGATIRTANARLLYVALAFATCTAAYVLALASSAAELGFCIVVAFIALRQYGETLARFDV